MTQTRGERTARATIRDVAQEAGVSVAAVSKVLRNAYGVSDSMRTNVQSAIEKLDYSPSSAARAMRGRTYQVGILLIEISNPFLPSLINAIRETLDVAGFQTLIGIGENERRMERKLIESMIANKMDGLILISPRLSGGKIEAYAKQVPLVTVAHHEDTARSFDTVNSDDYAGARMAVDRLIATGHTDIAMLSLPQRAGDENTVYIPREQGYMDAMRDAGLADFARIVRAHEAVRATPNYTEVPDVLTTGNHPSAVFCWSDMHAMAMLNAAKVAGLRVPEDVAVIGYDNTPSAAMPIASLSSIDQDADMLGRTAARSLLSRMDGRSTAEHIVQMPELVIRSSCASPDRPAQD